MPTVCGTKIARVFGPMAASTCATSMSYTPGWQSTNTGMRPFCTRGVSVVGKVTAGVITSSPARRPSLICGLSSVAIMSRFADEPELTRYAALLPK